MFKSIGRLLLISTLIACTSSPNESANGASTEFQGLKKELNVSIPEVYSQKVSGKRRGRLNSLKTSGTSWFSFKLEKPSNKLKIVIINTEGNTEFVWPIDNITVNNMDANEQMGSKETIQVDIIIDQQIQFYFDNQIKYSSDQNFQSMNNKIEVYLDNISQNIPVTSYNLDM